jgi:lactoylglutathione lyase
VRVEKLKYIIWAKELSGAVTFYRKVFGAEVAHESEVMAELVIAGGILGIHGGGQGQRTWTGLNFLVDDLFAACDALKTAGGEVLRPLDTPEEPAHLAMCVDPDGNEIMITRQRRS